MSVYYYIINENGQYLSFYSNTKCGVDVDWSDNIDKGLCTKSHQRAYGWKKTINNAMPIGKICKCDILKTIKIN